MEKVNKVRKSFKYISLISPTFRGLVVKIHNFGLDNKIIDTNFMQDKEGFFLAMVQYE